ncbi:MAG: arginine--tRNA ligase [Chloroflexi bacterium]|nr:arginine--tRNA ligase [Chloroflexota bacterium]
MTTSTREAVAAAFRAAIDRAAADLGWPADAVGGPLTVEYPANPAHGDFALSAPLRLSKPLRKPPLAIAEDIRARFPASDMAASVEVAQPGFVNVRLADAWVARQADAIAAAGDAYGRSTRLVGKRIQVEFISANPTGPMTVGNARGGPIGDVIANALAFAGADVQREFYVEDGGGQVKRFGLSVALRYRELLGETVELTPDLYQGDYVKDIAAWIRERHGDAHRDLPLEEQARAFAPLAIDWSVEQAQRVTGKFGIRFDTWFRQSSFIESGYLAGTIEALRVRGVIVERDGVVFFETPEAVALRRDGDEGWVLVDARGEPKYLGTDIAYHRLCLEERGFDLKLDIWGQNTQYHLQQMRVALPVLGIDLSRFEVVIYQYVRFVHEGVLTRMGKRTGLYLQLEDVIDAVGKDVARWFFLQSSTDRPLDFDLELAIKQSSANPAYYVQYAHARISSIFRTAAERGLSSDGADVSLLTDPGEVALVKMLLRFPDLVTDVVERRAPHLLTVYCLELAGMFHTFYRDHRVVSDDAALSRARLRLVQAAQVTLRQALGLLGISAPEKM